jgi:uncharacterized membrane protein YgaE (UPF0421/DUF939 family)
MMDLKRKALRVGIAAGLCMLISNLLKLKFPFFVILPAVMPISTFFGETIKFGINRIIGTFIGALVGVLFAYIQTQNMLLTGLGVMFIIYVCDYLKWDSTTSIACLVFASIMVGVKGPSALIYSVHRLLDTFIGIAVTTIVNNYVFNPDMSKLLINKAKDIKEDLLNIADNKDFYENHNELRKIELELNDMKEKLRICSKEFRFIPRFSSIKDDLEHMTYTISVIFEQVKAINYINEDKNATLLSTNDISTAVNIHKNIFFNEMKNLNKIIDHIT